VCIGSVPFHRRSVYLESSLETYERAALRWLRRFIDERLPHLTEVALAELCPHIAWG
jgi:hypothetical protein